MGFFNWLFRKKEDIEINNDSTNYETEDKIIETVKVNESKNIIKTKCPCGHKKAKKNNRNEIICRRCKSIIGSVV